MIQLKKMPGDLEEAVRQREQEDAGTGGILLYGSSHFAVWREEWLTRQMAPYRLYNRAFGGSTAEEALYYYPRAGPAGRAPGAALLRGRQRHPYGLHAGGGLGTDPPGALLGPDRRGRTSAGGPSSGSSMRRPGPLSVLSRTSTTLGSAPPPRRTRIPSMSTRPPSSRMRRDV